MNPVLAAIAPSMIRDLHGRKRPSSIDLGLGEPILRPEMAPFEEAFRWIAEHGCPYSPNQGFEELRATIARHYDYPGLQGPGQVCITHGSQEGLYLAIKGLLDPARDEVVIVEPCYPLYSKLCQTEGLACRSVALSPAEGFRPRAETVLEALGPRTRMVILASPSNPTGRVWPAVELERLARGLLERPGPPVWVLLDEVYRELCFTGAYASLAMRYPATLVVNSLSKSNALTGLRLGWIMAPTEVMPALVKIHQFLTTAAGTPAQRVALAIFEDAARLRAHHGAYAAARRELLAILHELELPHVVPEGSFYAMIRLKETMPDSVAAAYRLLETQDVVVIPGRAFGVAAEGWVRVSWVAPSDQLREGLGRLAQMV